MMYSVYELDNTRYCIGQTIGGKFAIFYAKIDKRRKSEEWKRLDKFNPLKGASTMQKRLDNHADEVGWKWIGHNEAVPILEE